MTPGYQRVKSVMEILLEPNSSRIQAVVKTLKGRKEHGYDYQTLGSVVTSLGPFVDGASYTPGEAFPDLFRVFSELSDEQKKELDALYRKKLEILEKKFDI